MNTNRILRILTVAFMLLSVETLTVFADASLAPPPVILSKPSKGKVKATAAINADGTVANCFKCVSATKLTTGTYEIRFAIGPDITANNGFSRWVQADTLQGGLLTTRCATADRENVPSAVLVTCVDSQGASADTPFFLFIAR